MEPKYGKKVLEIVKCAEEVCEANKAGKREEVVQSGMRLLRLLRESYYTHPEAYFQPQVKRAYQIIKRLGIDRYAKTKEYGKKRKGFYRGGLPGLGKRK